MIKGIDGPARIEADEVGVENLSLELETTKAALQFPEIFVFFSG